MGIGRIVAAVVFLAVLAGVAWQARPYLSNIVRCVRLLREPMPAVLPVPVEGVQPADLVDTWGAARSEGRTHEGIDIFAPRNTQVLSATHGIVARRGWNRLGGRTVTVMGPGGYHHYYAHLEAWDLPDVGDWVEPGQVLGYVGTSGNAAGTPPHLHYGIYPLSGKAINPYPLLSAPPRPPPAPPGATSRSGGASR
jgi:murein DD-endopeptidase MepM/ murein hydrolase activator NlpD